jgi:hypothetical protein
MSDYQSKPRIVRSRWYTQYRLVVDHKRDKLELDFAPNLNRPWELLSHCMQQYADWLTAEYARKKASGDSPLELDAWYSKRLSWFRELIEPEEIKAKGF